MTNRAWLGVGAVFLLLFFCIIPELMMGILELGFVLLTGWIPSGGRLVTMLSQVGGGIWLFIAGCVGLWMGAHLFCRWLAKHHAGFQHKWMLQHTSTILGGMLLVLFAAMGALGAAHQVGWLIVSREPVFLSGKSRFMERLTLDRAVKELQHGTEINHWKLDQVREFYYREARNGFARDGQPYWEKYNLIFHNVTNNTFAAVELVPVDPTVREKFGVGFLRQGKEPRRVNQAEAKRLAAALADEKPQP